MAIPDLFAGKSDGSEWRGHLRDQLDYFAELRHRMVAHPYDRNALCTQNRFCVLTWHHPGECLALMTLSNIPPDPDVPRDRRFPQWLYNNDPRPETSGEEHTSAHSSD